MKKYEEMSVTELRKLTKERGLKQSEGNHKFTKDELIDNLISAEDDDDWNGQEEAMKEGLGFDVVSEERESNNEYTEESTVSQGSFRKGGYIPRQDDYIKFAHTIDEIKRKYQRRKRAAIYRYALKPGAEVIFLQVVTKDDDRDFFEKVRKAKVINVDRKTETVTIQMYYGEMFDISYNDILFIKADEEDRFPFDLIEFIRKSYSRTWRQAVENEEFKDC